MDRPALRTELAWAAALVASILIARVTFDDQVQVALFSPAAGVSSVWLLVAGSLPVLLWRSAFILTANFAVAMATGFEPSLALIGSLGGMVLPVLVRGTYCALRRVALAQAPTVSIRRPRDLLELVLVAIVAVVLASTITELLRSGTIGSTREAFVVMTSRNAVAVVVVGGALLILRERMLGRGGTRPGAGNLTGRAVELGLLALATVGIGALIFLRGDSSPLGFTAILVVAWAGYRFEPAVVSVYNLVFTTGVVAMTVAGYGPFAVLDDPWEGATLVQFFAGVTSMVALMLSLGVAERRELEAALAEHEAEARVRKERTRLAREVNDTIVQALVAAETALDLQLPGQARHNIGEASQQAREWIGELYAEEEVLPGAAVRREPAKLEAGRLDG